MPDLKDALISLRQHFGFECFREGQREVIGAILEDKDAVVVMPTGSGKSLCYQLPAMMRSGATLVVSPLIALMKDQVDALQSKGLPATFINSSIDPSEQRVRLSALGRGEFKLIYVAPERFRSGRFIEALQSISLSLFAVDEAHCVSTWGHDFRPDYLRLRSAIQSLGGVQTLALTATATPYVRADIIKQLGLTKPQTFVSGFDRPNLAISVVPIERERQKLTLIRRLALKHEGSAIVYASTRKAVEEVSAELKAQGLQVAAYHAGMSDSVRKKAQDDFMTGRAQMIVATNAFGMGIDKPDIRFVAHYQMPGSIEAYYQEIGRAGRDSLPSSCVLLFNYADKKTHDFFIEGSYPTANIVQDVYDALVSTGLKRIELSGHELAARAGVRNEMAVQSSLYLLERAGHLERRNRGIVMLDVKPVVKLRVDSSEVARRAQLERRKLREMIEFCYTESCYRAHILDYFGDRHHSPQCGTCGNCAQRHSKMMAPDLSKLSLGFDRDPQLRGSFRDFVARALNEDETLRVRKILACATRMKGRFGKNILAGTLRGSAAKNIMQAHLNELSTYGLLREMRQDDVMLYIEALVAARCLEISRGEYPTVSVTELGGRVMREQERVELALPPVDELATEQEEFEPPKTIFRTYTLYCQGLSLQEIAKQRNLVSNTVEGHLIDCIRAGLDVDISKFVSMNDCALIEKAIDQHGTDKLRSLRDSLPENMTYNMIRFVVADWQRRKRIESESEGSNQPA